VKHWLNLNKGIVMTQITQYTLEQLQHAAESDKLDTVLEQAGIPSSNGNDSDKNPVIHRKWSELEEFDRSTFDMKAYQKTLARE
jgi:hypothetical protein